MEREWLAYSQQVLERRLAPLRDRADGVLSVEPAGPHFVVVIKTKSRLRMLLAEQVAPRSDLTQSHLDLDHPLSLVAPYMQAMMLGLLWPGVIRRIYVAGLGGGRLPLVLHHHLPEVLIDCAEIEPVVLRAAERYFGLRRDERLRVAIADGREWLARLKDERRYDLMLIDVFLDNGYTPYRMATQEFFELARSRLTADGVLVVNLLASDPYFTDKIATAGSVFPGLALCPAGEDNQVLFASTRPMPGQESLTERAVALEATINFRFPFREWVPVLVFPAATHGRILRDDDPPPDYFQALPSFEGAFGRTALELPCPCGSGSSFGACHGGTGRETR
jgi:spermidine synthase